MTRSTRVVLCLLLAFALAGPASAADPGPEATGSRLYFPFVRTDAARIVVDHTSVALFERIPQRYLTAARALTMFYTDRSVGGNLDEGLDCLAAPHSSALNHCLRYLHIDPAYNLTPADVYWPGAHARPNWRFVECTSVICTLEQYGATPARVLGYFPSYLETPIIWESFFTNNPDGEDVYDLAAFEAAHPTVRMIYFTSSLSRGEVERTRRFNDRMRAWTAANGKILFDSADILSTTPSGRPCFDNRDGVPYRASATRWENYPDDRLNTPAICPHYTTEVDGGHLGSVSAGKIRLAKAYWVLMAQLAGWRPFSASASADGCEPPAKCRP